MMPSDIENVAEAARQIYEQKLRASLEADHMHEFVAIEPVSGEFFLGRTLSEAIGASRTKYPDRLAHAMRVGHKAAIHPITIVVAGMNITPPVPHARRDRQILQRRPARECGIRGLIRVPDA